MLVAVVGEVVVVLVVVVAVVVVGLVVIPSPAAFLLTPLGVGARGVVVVVEGTMGNGAIGATRLPMTVSGT